MGQEPLILSVDGQPVAALMPVGNADKETVSLCMNPEFIAILQESRASLKAEGGIPRLRSQAAFGTGLGKVPADFQKAPRMPVPKHAGMKFVVGL